MKSLSLALAVVLGLLALLGCGSKSDPYTYSKTPEEAIRRAYELCQAGKYSEAVRLYTDGPQLWEQTPSAAKDMVERACFYQGKPAARYEIKQIQVRGEAADVTTQLYGRHSHEPDAALYVGTGLYELVKRPAGWLIAMVI